MRYFGGKQRIAKPLAQFLNSQLKEGQAFYDLFCGSCNVVSKIDSNRKRFANDLHKELIAMWKYLQEGGELPGVVTLEEYQDVMKNRKTDKYPDWYKGFVGFGCSFGGRYFEGFARDAAGDDTSNYAAKSKRSTEKKFQTMKDVIFSSGNYSDVNLAPESMLYCDIPYSTSTKKYAVGSFDHHAFYNWAETKAKEGHTVLVSEYKDNLPEGWKIVWELDSKKSMRNKQGEQVLTTEIVMTPVV